MRLRTEALLADLEKLQKELPSLIKGVLDEDTKITKDAIALIQGASRERFQLAMDNLTTYVVDEAVKGNKRPLQMVASGEAFDL